MEEFNMNTNGEYNTQMNGGQINIEPPVEKEKDKRVAMSIVALVLSIIGCLCCCFLGAGIILCIPSAILGLIAMISGTGKGRVMGIISFVVSLIGIVLNLYMLITFVVMIDWDNFDYVISHMPRTDNKLVIRRWLEQLFKPEYRQYVRDARMY